MIIVSDNLRELIRQHNIVNENCFDETSISLSLDNNVIFLKFPNNYEFIYGNPIPLEFIQEIFIEDGEYLELKPKSTVLACSNEVINIPLGYFGLLQTKGSLARLFVSIHCSDGQIEPGFSGKITFEIINFSDFCIKIRPKQIIGDLFLLKTSTKQVKPYSGKYNKSDKPTFQK